MGRPRKSDARDVRELLLAEAQSIIAKSGEQALRTRAVASAVGVTEPALFHYFGSREGLIEEAQARRFETGQSDLYRAFHDATMKCSSKSEFARIVDRSLRAAFTPQRLPMRRARIDIAGSAVSRPQLMDRLSRAQRDSLVPAVDALEYAKERGWLPQSFDSKTFAYWIMSQMSGRFFAEIATDGQTLRKWNDMMVHASLTEMGLQPVKPHKAGVKSPARPRRESD